MANTRIAGVNARNCSIHSALSPSFTPVPRQARLRYASLGLNDGTPLAFGPPARRSSVDYISSVGALETRKMKNRRHGVSRIDCMIPQLHTAVAAYWVTCFVELVAMSDNSGLHIEAQAVRFGCR